MLESAVLGIVQGIFEWLPVSSEGVIVLLKASLFKSGLSLADLVGYALFLHLGTILAVLIYFRKEVASLFTALFSYKKTSRKNVINFYVISTFVSGIIGLVILKFLDYIEKELIFGAKGIALIIGFALLVTAFLQFKKKEGSFKTENDLKAADGFILGVLQGFSIIPGLSRSGLTVSGFLLRKFSDTTALKLSFIMSLPVVLAGNIVLNLDKFSFSLSSLVALAFSFLFGILTIHVLLRLSKKINFAWFALMFGLIVIVSIFAADAIEYAGRETGISLQEIVGRDASIIDKVSVDVDGDGNNETAVLYTPDSNTFYLAIADNRGLMSKIELLADSFYGKDDIEPRDLNGDGQNLEFVFETYSSLDADYVEVVGWSKNKEELMHYDFYKEGEILEELPVSSSQSDLKHENGFLVQEYQNNGELTRDYYSFSEEGERFDFIKTEKTPY